MFSVHKVLFIALVGVRLHLKAEAPICFLRAHYEPVKPLEEIEQIEENVEKFLHLGGMDTLVDNTLPPVPSILLPPHIPPDESNAEEIDGEKTLERNYVILYYLHLFNSRLILTMIVRTVILSSSAA